MFDWFKRPKGKVLSYRTLSCGTDIIEYTGPISDVQDEIRGLAASIVIADEWEAYKFTEEVFEEARKIDRRRIANTELLKKVNFSAEVISWNREYGIVKEDLTDALIEYEEFK